jgi:hypothetical protein
LNASAVFRLLLVVRVAMTVIGRISTGQGWRPYRVSLDAFYPHLAAGIAIAVYAGVLFVVIGLWQFRRWARMTYLVFILLSCLAGLLRHGPVITSSSFLALDTLVHVLDGCIIAMAFLPPVYDVFSGKGPNQSLQPIFQRKSTLALRHMKASAFLPRSRSKIVFVLVMASYGLFAALFLGSVADAFGAQHTRPGIFLQRGHPTLEVISLLVFAPVVESLILIAMIELLRWLRSPVWLQIGLPAIISAALHVPVSHALVVAPAWFIMAAAYLIWRRTSWKIGFVVIASIHALLNVNGAIWTISYAIHHAQA